MADQSAPPSDLRPMRPIKRVPLVEEMMPLTGPALTDPNDQPFATAPAAPSSAATALSAATPSFVTSPASAPSAASALASVAPAAAALVSAPSAAGALGAITPLLGSVAPALGGAAPVVSEIASAAPAAEALISSPSAATALGAAAPILSDVAPNAAQYANPLLQTVASHDLNPPFGDMADRAGGIGQPHPEENAQVREFLGETLKDKVPEEAVAEGVLKPALERAGIAEGAAKIGLGGALEALGVGAAGLVGGVVAGVFMGSKPLNEGEDEAVRRMHENDPAWQEMLRRQKEDPTYSPLHDDPQNPPPHSLDPVVDELPPDPVG